MKCYGAHPFLHNNVLIQEVIKSYKNDKKIITESEVESLNLFLVLLMAAYLYYKLK